MAPLQPRSHSVGEESSSDFAHRRRRESRAGWIVSATGALVALVVVASMVFEPNSVSELSKVVSAWVSGILLTRGAAFLRAARS